MPSPASHYSADYIITNTVYCKKFIKIWRKKT